MRTIDDSQSDSVCAIPIVLTEELRDSVDDGDGQKRREISSPG